MHQKWEKFSYVYVTVFTYSSVRSVRPWNVSL